MQQKLHEETPFELISTYQLNILRLKDALPFIIARSPDSEAAGKQSRVVCVSRFDEVFADRLETFREMVEEMKDLYSTESGWADKETLKPHLKSISDEVMSVLNRANGDIFQIQNLEIDRNARELLEFELRRPGITNLALAKYLILMTAVWPDWTRIIMIPHRVPVFSDPQPGGIVICEDKKSEKITAQELGQIGDLLSASIWPWVSLQSGKRSEIDTALKIVGRMSEAILHEHNWAFPPVIDLLVAEENWKSMNRAKADVLEAGIKVTSLSLQALCGLADRPDEWNKNSEQLRSVVQELQKQFRRLSSRFHGRPFEVVAPKNFSPAIPRLFVTILIEVLRNAFKHSDENATQLPVTLTVASTPGQQSFSVVIRNPGPEGKVMNAVDRYKQMRTEFDRTDHVLASTDSGRKGIPLVMVLVEFARGSVEYRLERDGQQHFLAVEISIRPNGEHHV